LEMIEDKMEKGIAENSRPIGVVREYTLLAGILNDGEQELFFLRRRT